MCPTMAQVFTGTWFTATKNLQEPNQAIGTQRGLAKKTDAWRGAWGAQLVKRPTLAQVMVSQSVGSSPASGSVLAARSLEPASDSVSPSLSLSLPLPRLRSPSMINKR